VRIGSDTESLKAQTIVSNMQKQQAWADQHQARRGTETPRRRVKVKRVKKGPDKPSESSSACGKKRTWEEAGLTHYRDQVEGYP